jgi:hypothetical protein
MEALTDVAGESAETVEAGEVRVDRDPRAARMKDRAACWRPAAG